MTALLGKDCFLEIQKNSQWTPFMCSETVTLTINTEYVETKTEGDGPWGRPRPQKNTYTIAMSGLIPAMDTGVHAFDLYQYQKQFVHLEFRITFKLMDGTAYKGFQGEAMVQTSTFAAAVDFVTGSFDLIGRGPLLDADDLCDASVTGLLIESAGINRKRVTVTGFTGATPTRYAYAVGINISLVPRRLWQTSLSPSFFINVSQSGTVAIRIIAVCDNGIDGTAYQTTFAN